MLLLMKRLEDLHSELVHLKELRGGFDDDDEDDEDTGDEAGKEITGADEAKKDPKSEEEGGSDEKPKPKKLTKAEKRLLKDKEECEERISEGAGEAEMHYHHLL